MTPEDRKRAFLKDLTALTRKHGVIVRSDGVHSSVELTDAADTLTSQASGAYLIDGPSAVFRFDWAENVETMMRTGWWHLP